MYNIVRAFQNSTYTYGDRGTEFFLTEFIRFEVRG